MPTRCTGGWIGGGRETVSRRFEHGWKPESGFLRARWQGYNEALILYVLGFGSPTQSLPEKSYRAWTSTYVRFRCTNRMGIDTET